MVLEIILRPAFLAAKFPLRAAAASSVGVHAVGAGRRALRGEFQVPSRPAYRARVGGRIFRAVAVRLAREAHPAVAP